MAASFNNKCIQSIIIERRKLRVAAIMLAIGIDDIMSAINRDLADNVETTALKMYSSYVSASN